jgi:tetratricopeptide (TPR) repeat protein
MSTTVADLARRLERADYGATIEGCERALRADPRNVALLELLGLARVHAGAPDAGAAALRQALALAPGELRLYLNLAVALERAGDAAGAVAALEGARARFGEPAGLLLALGHARLAARDPAGAVEVLERLVAANPADAGALNNLGSALVQLGRFEAALVPLEAAARVAPRYVRPLVNLGKALRELGRSREAIARLEAALALEPDYVPALVNLGDALLAAARADDARAVLARAVKLAPRHAQALASLGVVDFASGREAEGLAALRHAASLDPASGEIRGSLGHALFVSGDWRAAWPCLEARERRTLGAVRIAAPAGLARWDGRFAPGLSLALVAEQGLGDTLQFARYARPLGARGVRTTLVCPPALHRLIAASELVDALAAPGEAMPAAVHAWLPLMSLPAVFATEPATVPLASGYLAADPDNVARWAPRLGAPAGLRVGLAWRGNPLAETGTFLGRSPGLAPFAPLLEVEGASFFALQKGAGLEELAAAPFRDRVRALDGLDAGMDAFLDTAAVMASLDLVITSDTSIAHLAGALGRPVWICVAKEPDWRWMRSGSSSPWYASARLFRQPAPGDWTSVFVEVRAALVAAADAARARSEGGEPPAPAPAGGARVRFTSGC